MPMHEAASLCKTLLRNGFDAYVINASLQMELYSYTGKKEMDLACEPNFETLSRLFNNVEPGDGDEVIAMLRSEETGFLYRFYPTDVSDSSHPDVSITRLTSRILTELQSSAEAQYAAVRRFSEVINSDSVIDDLSCGSVRLAGIPQLTLRRNYSLGIRVLRMAANYEMPVDPNTWMAIVQAASFIGDYVPAREFVEEWRKVSAENMWLFIKLLADTTILHQLIPEVAALTSLRQNVGKNVDEEESVFQHTLDCMKAYPEESLHHDWIGAVAVMFLDVGKLYTAESLGPRWTFYQHHRVGAKVTRHILRRLRFDPEDIDSICNLVRNQLRFQSMLTDRGIRRFLELPDTDRLIEIARANIKAQKDGNYTNFNHNMKYMERGDLPMEMLEPLLNGNQIMEVTGLPPGPEVGQLRDTLLEAQKRGEVKNREQAMAFVCAQQTCLLKK